MTELVTYIPAEKGYKIQVGDIIQTDNIMGIRNHKVTRVTAKYAFFANNEISESKFNRIYSDFGWGVLPRQKWRMTKYYVLKKIL
jgi:hypothetical protein